ncbi:tautomerase family protein [uncultured Cellulomonas sp.]|uniref:tautomerase family protein n=1 Tax=uncultured Cellulomonas sp. TaxID=189682 RepID=UPI00260E2085|nr:tautomerase family protein [uncultured Cellulomonas sp.]
MTQVKIYGRRDVWAGRQREVSDALQAALVTAWDLPAAKRFHRFLLLDDDDLVAPGRSPAYLVVELVAFTGRSDAAVRRLMTALNDDVAPALGLAADDLEAVLIEVPASRWAIRGVVGDELSLDYRVDV